MHTCGSATQSVATHSHACRSCECVLLSKGFRVSVAVEQHTHPVAATPCWGVMLKRELDRTCGTDFHIFPSTESSMNAYCDSVSESARKMPACLCCSLQLGVSWDTAAGIPQLGCRSWDAAAGMPQLGCRSWDAAAGMPQLGCRSWDAAAKTGRIYSTWSLLHKQKSLCGGRILRSRLQQAAVPHCRHLEACVSSAGDSWLRGFSDRIRVRLPRRVFAGNGSTLRARSVMSL